MAVQAGICISTIAQSYALYQDLKQTVISEASRFIIQHSQIQRPLAWRGRGLTCTDVLALYTNILLNEGNILPRVLRKLLPFRDARRFCHPPWPCLVHDLGSLQRFQICLERLKLFAVHVLGRNFDLRKIVEDIDLRDVERAIAVDGRRVP